MKPYSIAILLAILCATPLFGLDLFGEGVPQEAEKSVYTLDKDLNKAFRNFIKSIDKAIAKAEKKGDVGLSAKLKTAKQEILADRHFSELGEAAEKDEIIAVQISSKWLKKQFNATKASVNRKGVVTLYYDFVKSSEAADFELGGDDVSITKGMLALGPQTNLTHTAKWDGSIEVKMEVAHANWAGSHLSIGGKSIRGKQYKSAWFVRLGNAEALFSKNIKQSGNPKEYRALSYKMTKSRTIVTFGKFAGTPVTFADAGGQLNKGSVIVHGADGGANIKSLIITGTLNMDAFLE